MVAAFTAAATIHLSAVALAALHHEAPAISPEERFADIDVYPNIDPPATPQIEIPVPPPPIEPTDFVEPPGSAATNPETAGLCSNSAAGTNATSWFEESKGFCPERAAT